jgi:hypothetical protein
MWLVRYRYTAAIVYIAVIGVMLVGGATAELHAGVVESVSQVVIEADRLEPRMLETLTGTRVVFLNRTGRPVHLQFSDERGRHEVVQVPVTGPLWAVFHRPGTHPYTVHIYGRHTVALDGVVSVTTDATHQWQSGTCDVLVEDNCLVP